MKKKTTKYRVRNWPKYNKALVNRGRLSMWIDIETLTLWHAPKKDGQIGHPKKYSDLAIECMAILKEVYRLPLRAAQGLMQSVLNALKAGQTAPDYSTLSRRRRKLKLSLPHTRHDGMHLVVDSTGVKVYGEGEWKVRQHGIGKRRTWRKLHIGVDEATGEIVTAVVTTNAMGDSQVVEELLGLVPDQIRQMSADGAYDTRSVYEQLARRGVIATIPPRKGAHIWQHANSKCQRKARDENLRGCRKLGRKKWKEQSGYHRRSLAETTMFRYKQILGAGTRAKSFGGQSAEMLLRCKALNIMTQHGRPVSYRVEG